MGSVSQEPPGLPREGLYLALPAGPWLTFQDEGHEGDEGRVHLGEDFPVGFVIPAGVLQGAGREDRSRGGAPGNSSLDTPAGPQRG